ncbi:MAG: hypothetical protein AAF327_09675 [Cyanobacteria bacterium P01_A01_bin.37]
MLRAPESRLKIQAPMFYPEANVLMKGKIEERSGTPAYKRVPVFAFSSVTANAYSHPLQ